MSFDLFPGASWNAVSNLLPICSMFEVPCNKLFMLVFCPESSLLVVFVLGSNARKERNLRLDNEPTDKERDERTDKEQENWLPGPFSIELLI